MNLKVTKTIELNMNEIREIIRFYLMEKDYKVLDFQIPPDGEAFVLKALLEENTEIVLV